MHATAAPSTPNAPVETFTLEVRPAQESDTAYLHDAWLNAARRNSGLGHRLSTQQFFDLDRPRVAKLLESVEVLVAHPAGDPDTILGFLAAEIGVGTPVVHWLYVRSAWRGNGIARALLDAAGIAPESLLFTCWTSDAPSLVRKFPGAAHYPWAGALGHKNAG